MEWVSVGILVIVVIAFTSTLIALNNKKDKLDERIQELIAHVARVEKAKGALEETANAKERDHRSKCKTMQGEFENKLVEGERRTWRLRYFITLFTTKAMIDEVLGQLARELADSFDINVSLLLLQHEDGPDEASKRLEELQREIDTKKRAFWEAVAVAREVADYREVKSFKEFLPSEPPTEAEKPA